MIIPCLTYLDMQQAMAEIRSVTRAGPIWIPNGLGVTPGARRAASRGGARPAHLQRPPRPHRRYLRHKLVPARPGPLSAGGGT
jgi:hypothetical protein